MKRNRLIIALIVLCMTMTLYGCSRGTKNIGTPRSSLPGSNNTGTAQSVGTTTGQGATVNTTTPPGTTTTGVTPLPTELKRLESYAVRVINEVNTKQWKKAQSTMRTMILDGKKAKNSMTIIGVPQNIINNVMDSLSKADNAVKAKKSYEARKWANIVTRYLADAMDSYKLIVPSDVTRLNHHLRQIELDIEKKDWNRASENTGLVVSLWRSVRLQLNRSNANVVKMDKIVPALDSAVKSKKTASIKKDCKDALNALVKVKKDFEMSVRKP